MATFRLPNLEIFNTLTQRWSPFPKRDENSGSTVAKVVANFTVFFEREIGTLLFFGNDFEALVAMYSISSRCSTQMALRQYLTTSAPLGSPGLNVRMSSSAFTFGIERPNSIVALCMTPCGLPTTGRRRPRKYLEDVVAQGLILTDRHR